LRQFFGISFGFVVVISSVPKKSRCFYEQSSTLQGVRKYRFWLVLIVLEYDWSLSKSILIGRQLCCEGLSLKTNKTKPKYDSFSVNTNWNTVISMYGSVESRDRNIYNYLSVTLKIINIEWSKVESKLEKKIESEEKMAACFNDEIRQSYQ
jgi:hypothetical protein